MVRVVYGYPNSGKSTYIQKHVGELDIVLEGDSIRTMLNNRKYVFNERLEPFVHNIIKGTLTNLPMEMTIWLEEPTMVFTKQQRCELFRHLKHEVVWYEIVSNRPQVDRKDITKEKWISVCEEFKSKFEPIQADEWYISRKGLICTD